MNDVVRLKFFKFMKSTTIRLFQVIFKNTTFFFLDVRRGGLLFINLFCLGSKGCKLMKINTSFRIRGQERNIFYILSQ